MIGMDDRQLKQYERDLKTFHRRAYPFATRNTVNGAAFTAQRFGRENIENNMVTRNKFTVRSVRVKKATGLVVRKQEAVTGSIAPYMDEQEFGGRTNLSGKHRTRIPTSFASGEGENSRPRRRLPRNVNKLRNIRLRRAGAQQWRTRRQRAFLTALAAANDRQKFVFWEGAGGNDDSRGIYRVYGKRRRRGRYTRVRMKMVYNMRRKPSIIPKNPWLGPATDRTVKLIPSIYRRQLFKQLRRNGHFALWRSG